MVVASSKMAARIWKTVEESCEDRTFRKKTFPSEKKKKGTILIPLPQENTEM